MHQIGLCPGPDRKDLPEEGRRHQYPNLLETMLDKITTDHDEKQEETTSTYKKLIVSRESNAFEELRLNAERFVRNGNKKPAVFLFQTGNLAMRKARAGFTTNFFGCAGFEIIDNAGFQSMEEGISAAIESAAEIIVICSSDEEYEQVAPPVCREIKSRKPGVIILVAGYPKDQIESLKAAGVDDFIHLRSNLLQTLEQYQKKLGII